MTKESLLSKYTRVLELYRNADQHELAWIIERSVSLIKYKRQDLNVQHQIAGAFVIVQLYLKAGSKFNTLQIEELLDEFYKYFDEEYDKYITSLSMMRERFDADLSFYWGFINKKIKGV